MSKRSIRKRLAIDVDYKPRVGNRTKFTGERTMTFPLPAVRLTRRRAVTDPGTPFVPWDGT